MTDIEALTAAFERAGGVCECIGGGCPALTHRPDVNRCYRELRTLGSTNFFTVRRFADRTDPANIVALCSACAESPRRSMERIIVADADAPGTRETPDADEARP